MKYWSESFLKRRIALLGPLSIEPFELFEITPFPVMPLHAKTTSTGSDEKDSFVELFTYFDEALIIFKLGFVLPFPSNLINPFT